MTGDAAIRSARDSYVQGLLSLEEFEAHVWDVLTGVWSPTSAMAAVLKEAWTESALKAAYTDDPGAVVFYRPPERPSW